ncbi:MAG: hypothetical protein CL878_09130 [Dehalococcoidia bacterium]|nr:hypothetical protein [Dehalococcoidia bacterium]
MTEAKGLPGAHRRRLLAALDHLEPDRVPLDFGSTRVTGCTLAAYRRLRSYLGLPAKEPVCIDPIQQLAQVEDDVLERLDVDTRGVFIGAPDGFRSTTERHDGAEEYVDEWGVRRRKPPGGYYFDLVKSPFAGEDPQLSWLDQHPWPDPADPGRYRGLQDEVAALRAAGEYAIVFSPASGPLHITQYLRGFEGWYTDFVLNPAFLEGLFEHVFGFACAVAEQSLRLIGDQVDVVFVGDDLGTQRGPQVSPALYRQFIKPFQRRLFDVYHTHSKGRALYHTCGSVVDLLPDLVEIGVDILNPVQVTAAGMEPARLKQEFGRHLSFWGGVDTQRVLPYGSPAEVRREVAQRITELGEGGGYVVNSVHNVQPDVPPANLVAMFGAGHEFGRHEAARAVTGAEQSV